MINNPEFLRNLWLELNQHRLLGMPTTLFAIFFLIYLVAEPHYAGPVNTGAMILYYLLTLLWGTRLAGDALINEVRDHTWDQQRMTSIPPWSMAWGKLFGSTIYVWYGASICLAIYIVSANLIEQANIFIDTVIMIAIAVFAHSVAMLMSLQTLARKREVHRSASYSFMIIGIVSGLPFINLSLNANSQFIWFDSAYASKDFFLYSLIFFCAWLLIAIYRNMRSELQFRRYPFVWLGFLASFTVYVSGLINSTSMLTEQLHTLRIFVAFVSLATLTYIMIFMENKDPILIRRISLAISDRNIKKLLEYIPNWLITLLAVYIVCPILIMAGYNQLDSLNLKAGWDINFNAAVISTTLFLSRDVLLILFFNFSKNRNRADFTALVYLAALYWLIPSIAAALGLVTILPAFFPFGSGNATLSIISGLIQTILLSVLLIYRIRRL